MVLENRRKLHAVFCMCGHSHSLNYYAISRLQSVMLDLQVL